MTDFTAAGGPSPEKIASLDSALAAQGFTRTLFDLSGVGWESNRWTDAPAGPAVGQTIHLWWSVAGRRWYVQIIAMQPYGDSDSALIAVGAMTIADALINQDQS